MDPGADAAALAVVRRATSLAPDAAAEALRGALVGHLGDLTIADAAARSGRSARTARGSPERCGRAWRIEVIIQRMRLRALLALSLALGCAAPRPRSEPASTPRADADPCEGVMAFEAIATEAGAALQARARARYVELAAGLRQGAACDSAVEVQLRRGRLLAAMAFDLLASEPGAARAMALEGFEVLSVVAGQLNGAAEAAEAARLQYELLDRAMYITPHQPQPPRRRSCNMNSMGVCPGPSGKPRTDPYSVDDRNELRANEVYARFGDDPDRVRAVRYMLFRILAEHRELGRELASVGAFITEHDGHPLAAWAAFLVIDELTMRVTESEARSVADFEALVRWIERLETMKLWQLDSAGELRSMVPILQAGASWQLALAARERGDYAGCADRFLAIFKRYDNHDRAAELLLRASQCLADDQRPDEAARVRKQLQERFPNREAARRSR